MYGYWAPVLYPELSQQRYIAYLYRWWFTELYLSADTTLCLCRYSGLPYDVTNEEALSHEPVQKLMEESIQQLRHWSDKFLELILSSLDQIPYGMRCIAKCMYDSLTEKFPTSPEKDVLKVM